MSYLFIYLFIHFLCMSSFISSFIYLFIYSFIIAIILVINNMLTLYMMFSRISFPSVQLLGVARLSPPRLRRSDVRDAGGLQQLPPEEQRDLHALWGNVAGCGARSGPEAWLSSIGAGIPGQCGVVRTSSPTLLIWTFLCPGKAGNCRISGGGCVQFGLRSRLGSSFLKKHLGVHFWSQDPLFAALLDQFPRLGESHAH